LEVMRCPNSSFFADALACSLPVTAPNERLR